MQAVPLLPIPISSP